jgi:hypothetical protein
MRPAQMEKLRRLGVNQLGSVGCVDGDMPLSCNAVAGGVGTFT